MKVFFKYFSLLIGALAIVYIAGPNPTSPDYNTSLPFQSLSPAELEEYIYTKEKKYAPLKPGNEAQIIWQNDSVKQKTKFALVYLHGFSASHEEGSPVHKALAKRYGMNLFLSRISDHGRDTAEQLVHYSAQQSWDDAKEAYALGKCIGENVILLSTSTGGTLSLMLCSKFKDIYAQILMSPNIKIKDPSAFLLNNPWGLNIARNVIGSDYRIVQDSTELYGKYWNTKYRIEALVELEELLESSMTKNTFSKITAPTLLLYYYKDENHQDPVVSVAAMQNMYTQLGTSLDKKSEKAMPSAGNHILGSPIKSKDHESVKIEIQSFFENKLKIEPIEE